MSRGSVVVAAGRIGLSFVLLMCSRMCLQAASFDDTANGNYNADATWVGGSANPAGTTADDVTIDGNSVTITTSSQATNDVITVSGSGKLKVGTEGVTPGPSDALGGATVVLNGGVLFAHAGSPFVGGDIVVSANSRYEVYGFLQPIATNRSLTFTAPCTLTATNTKGDYQVGMFFESVTITNDVTLLLGSAGNQSIDFQMSNVTMGAANTVTAAGATYGNIHIMGNNTAMLGTLTVQSGFWGTIEARSSNALGSATVNVNGGTLHSSIAHGLGTSRVSLGSGAVVTKPTGVASAFKNATIVMNGGTVVPMGFQDDNQDLGGVFLVASASKMQSWRGTTTFDELDFASAASMTFTNVQGGGDQWNVVFRSVVVTNSGTIYLAGGGNTYVKSTNTVVGATNTLTFTACAGGTMTLQIDGPIGARLRGSADVLTGTSFTLLDRVSGTLDYTTSASLDTAGGLWSAPALVDDTDLTVTLANNMGDVAFAAPSSFVAEDGGHVVLKNLVPGTEYTLHLNLAGGDANKAAVKAEMLKNPLWTLVDNSTETGYEVRAVFMARGAGDFRFAWDGSAGGRLGDSLTGVKMTVPAQGTIIILR